jgi:hypothetical protein
MAAICFGGHFYLAGTMGSVWAADEVNCLHARQECFLRD